MNIGSAISTGMVSGIIAEEIAKRKGRTKPSIKDRCHAALSILFPLIAFVSIMFTGYFTRIDRLLDRVYTYVVRSTILSIIAFCGFIILIILGAYVSKSLIGFLAKLKFRYALAAFGVVSFALAIEFYFAMTNVI